MSKKRKRVEDDLPEELSQSDAMSIAQSYINQQSSTPPPPTQQLQPEEPQGEKKDFDDTESVVSDVSEITNPDFEDDRGGPSIGSNSTGSGHSSYVGEQMSGANVVLRTIVGVCLIVGGLCTVFPPMTIFSPFIIPITGYIGGKMVRTAIKNYIHYHPESIVAKIQRGITGIISREDQNMLSDAVNMGIGIGNTTERADTTQRAQRNRTNGRRIRGGPLVKTDAIKKAKAEAKPGKKALSATVESTSQDARKHLAKEDYGKKKPSHLKNRSKERSIAK